MPTFPHCAAIVTLGSKTQNVFPDTKDKCFCRRERQMFLQAWKEEVRERNHVHGKKWGEREKEKFAQKGKTRQTFASYHGRKIRPRVPVCLKRNKPIMWELQQFYCKFCFKFLLILLCKPNLSAGSRLRRILLRVDGRNLDWPATVHNSRKPTKQNSDWGEPMMLRAINLRNLFGTCF